MPPPACLEVIVGIPGEVQLLGHIEQRPYVGVDFLYDFTQGAIARKPLTSRPCECSSCSVKALS